MILTLHSTKLSLRRREPPIAPDTIAKLGGEADDVAAVVEPTGHLLWHGVDPDVTMALMLAWKRVRCRPPLEDEEVIRTVRLIERTQTKGNDGSLRGL